MHYALYLRKGSVHQQPCQGIIYLLQLHFSEFCWPTADWGWVIPSACQRCNLTPVSYFSKAAPISLFWAPKRLSKLLEMCFARLQNSPYFCVINRACDVHALRVGKTLTPHFTDFFTDFEKKVTVLRFFPLEARALCARKTLTPHFTDFFTGFEKKTDCFAV